MGQISSKLRTISDGALGYWCQGCEEMHVVRVGEGAGPRWGYNGNPDAPTFTPSVLVRSGHFIEGKQGGRCWCDCAAEVADYDGFKCSQCHTFIVDGRVQFLDDCSHQFAGQTLPLPDLPPEHRDR